MAAQIKERISVNASGSTVTLDFDQLQRRKFIGAAAVYGEKTVVLKNDAYADELVLELAIPDESTQVDTITLSGTSGTANVTGAGGLTKLVTYGTAVAQVATVTLSGTSGTANITVAGGLTKLVTFNTSLTQTATDFDTTHSAAYTAVGITVTTSGADIIFTAAAAGTGFSAPVITNATGDLDGTVVATTANKTALTDTAEDFVTSHEADYAAEGITITSSGSDIIFTSDTAGVAFTSPVITNVTGNLAGNSVPTTANSADVLVLTFPSTFVAGASESRFASNDLTLTGEGSYTITASFTGSVWKMYATADAEWA